MPCRTKEEQREYQRLWVKGRRDAWIEENGPCSSCGSSEDLQVDHINRSTKSMNPSQIWSRKEEDRLKELSKCQVLCMECHKLKTKIEMSTAGHGTFTMYRYHRCRCDMCREAGRLQKSDWRAKNKIPS
jgi:5-methylcytosine-specific restriction endonuclease McrA